MRRNVIDRLALLCTLHADGPRTLRLLREAGCASIEKLGSLPADKVGKVLGLPAAAARRLIREATRLEQRLEPDLEQEEVTYPAAAELRGIKPPPASYRLEEPVLERSNGLSRLGLRDQELMKRVVDRWRSTEQPGLEVEPEALEQLLPEPAQVPLEPLPSGLQTIELSARDLQALEPPPPERTGLRPGEIDGLDAEACLALSLADVQSLEELATCPVDELTLHSGLTFTRARTLQFRAGKRLAQQAEQVTEVKPFSKPRAAEERLSPSERPIILIDEPQAPPVKAGGLAWDDSGAAGPFA